MSKQSVNRANTFNTGIASKYLILSKLYRLELEAYISQGNKKSIDIRVFSKNGIPISVDVKSVRGYSSLVVNNVIPKKDHFLVFVIYNNKFYELNCEPEIFIVPSVDITEITETYGNEKRVMKGSLKKYKDSWHYLSGENNKKKPKKIEKEFEILGKGGGISISRQKDKSEELFLYNHNEIDPTEEGLDINEKGVYRSFENPFQLINTKYPWYMLHIKTVHNDYRKFIIDKLIEKLNEKSIKPDYLKYSRNQLEESLGIKLAFNLNNEKAIWYYMEIDELKA